jgi:ATP:ADP antiporter, AAA family
MSEPSAAEESGGFLYRWLARLIDVRREEVAALAWAWLYIFAVLSAYYIMRPIRDQMGVAGGVNNLQWLFTGTLIGMLCLNIPYSYLVKTLPRTRFIPISYRFFAVNILIFAALLYFADNEQAVWIGRAFFIWISIFNLFVVSVFWALIVDIFSTEQGKRLFGFIAAGATIGAIAGSGLTALLARTVPVTFLLIGSVLLLEVAVFATRRLSRLAGAMQAEPASAADQPVGGNVLAGITHPFKSSYLVNVSVFILLFGITATFLYFQQARIVSQNFTDRGAQTAFFATIDLLVNCLTLVVEIFLTGRILRYFGVGIALAFLPLLTLCGFATLAFVPALGALVVFQVLRRSSDYAIARPAREVLYTVLPREDRYKAKNFIDTVVYRAGDQVGAWSYALLAALSLGATEVAATAAVLSVVWLFNGLWLGRRQESMAAAKTAEVQTV